MHLRTPYHYGLYHSTCILIAPIYIIVQHLSPVYIIVVQHLYIAPIYIIAPNVPSIECRVDYWKQYIIVRVQYCVAQQCAVQFFLDVCRIHQEEMRRSGVASATLISLSFIHTYIYIYIYIYTLLMVGAKKDDGHLLHTSCCYIYVAESTYTTCTMYKK